MRSGRPKAILTMSSDERTHLSAITRSRSLPAALTLRAKIVLACERGPSNAVVATRLLGACIRLHSVRARQAPGRERRQILNDDFLCSGRRAVKPNGACAGSRLDERAGDNGMLG